MTCAQVRDRLDSLLAGRLSGVEARDVRTHLAGCAACLSTIAAADRAEILPIFDREVEPASALYSRFHARLAAHRADRRAVGGISPARIFHQWPGVTPGRIAVAGTVAAFLFLGIYLDLNHAPAPGPVSNASEISIAEDLPLLQNLEVIKNLDMLEDFDAIEDISQDTPAPDK